MWIVTLRNIFKQIGNNIKKHEQKIYPKQKKKKERSCHKLIFLKVNSSFSYFKSLWDASANFCLQLHFLIFSPFLSYCMKTLH